MTAATGLLVTLPQMVDLALGSPEIGAVNFNLLGAALQVIIQQLKLNDFTIDFRGPDAERIQGLLSTAKPGATLKITETTDGETVTVIPQKEEQVQKIDPRRSSREEPQVGSVRTSEKIVVVEQNNGKTIQHLPHVVVGVSQELFIQIHSDVEELKSKMTDILELPNNDTVIEAVRAQGQDKVTPVIDMWHALNISKRLDATETGMDKLASMFEDLVQDISGLMGKSPNEAAQGSSKTSIFGQLCGRLDIIENKLNELESGIKPGGHKEDGEVDLDIINDVQDLKQKIKTLDEELAHLIKGSKGKTISDLFKEIEDFKSKGVDKKDNEDESSNAEEYDTKEITDQFANFATQINNLDETLTGQITSLQDQLLAIEKELGTILENQNTKTDAITDTTSLGDMYSKFLKVQEDIDALNKVTERLAEDLEERTLTMESLMEQMESLKTTKADREDLEDALADKADATIVNRKVSTMQFESACEDLSRNIEETMTKLQQQEELWQNTLEELQLTIGGKLDKTEFDPLRDFVNRKIKSLQQRLKALLAMKQEQEAAGTKSKLLKNVNCISCDKDVVMQKENMFTTFPSPPVMPGNRSIKPYITYELDAVRKQQKTVPQGRNMNYLENALQEKKEPKKEKPGTDKTIPMGHLCNRYCGGSHTMTLPQQRVAHIGHFLSQWGPQAIPLDEAQIMGTDGQMYKSREGGPDSPKKIETEETRRVSAQMQTENVKVQRMSSTLQALRNSKSSRSSKKSLSKNGNVTISVPEQPLEVVKEEGEHEEPVKENEEVAEMKGQKREGSRSSLKKKRSIGSKQSTEEHADIKDVTPAKRHSSKNITQTRQSLKRSQGSLKKISETAVPKRTSAQETETAEGQMEEKTTEESAEIPAEAPPEPEPSAPENTEAPSAE